MKGIMDYQSVRRWFKLAGLVCMLLWLASCRSVPVKFYTLTGSLPDKPLLATTQKAGYRVSVLPVQVPSGVDRAPLVLSRGDSRVQVLDGRRWIAPLPEQIQQVLSRRLTRYLGVQDVYGMAKRGTLPVYRIHVNIGRFQSALDQYALLEARWSIHLQGDKKVDLQCTSVIEQSAGQGFDALIEAHQATLRTLSQTIAQSVQSMVDHTLASCPLPVQHGLK